MNNNICIPFNYFCVIFCFTIGLSVWYIHKEKIKYKSIDTYNYDDNLINHLSNIIQKLKTSEDIFNDPYKDMISRENTNILYNDLRDKKVLYDDFFPPERRLPRDINTNYIKYKLSKPNFISDEIGLESIPTRGYPDNYQLIGIVTRQNNSDIKNSLATEAAYNLFGRQTYPGSSQYEYYVEGKINGTKVKIPLSIPGNKEINDKQEIKIPGTISEYGTFIVLLFFFFQAEDGIRDF